MTDAGKRIFLVQLSCSRPGCASRLTYQEDTGPVPSRQAANRTIDSLHDWSITQGWRSENGKNVCPAHTLPPQHTSN